MIVYKLNITDVGANRTVNQFVDGNQTLSIPFDPQNADYQQFLKDIKEGVKLLDADGNAVTDFVKELP